MMSSYPLDSRRPTAAVWALAAAIWAETGGAPSRRSNPSRWPPSSATAMVTAHWFARAWASAAFRICLTSAADMTGFDFIEYPRDTNRNGRVFHRTKPMLQIRLSFTVRNETQAFDSLTFYAYFRIVSKLTRLYQRISLAFKTCSAA